jgi:hypothetical protein
MCSLIDFANKVQLKNRISFGDVRRLSRNILPDGIGSREEAELLINLDRYATRSDPAWEPWLVATIVDYVVWTERPTGVVSEDAAYWLAATLAGNDEGHPTKIGRRIAREVAQEAQAFENLALAALGASLSKAKSRRALQGDAAVALAA